jgi:hypothetical protein
LVFLEISWVNGKTKRWLWPDYHHNITSSKYYFQGLSVVIPGDILGQWWDNHTFCPLYLNPRLIGCSPVIAGLKKMVVT